jgi:prepilin-type N-terminal cleavage/methylation domain-containing protein
MLTMTTMNPRELIGRRAGARFDQRGFSLVEIITVVAIIGILSALATPSFITWKRKFDLKNAASEMANVMFQARSKSIFERKNYTVAVDYTTNNYTVTPAGGAALQRLGRAWGSVDLYADDSDEFCPPLSGQNIVFRPNSSADSVGFEAVYLRSQHAAVTIRYRVKVLGATGKSTTERWMGGAWVSAY